MGCDWFIEKYYLISYKKSNGELKEIETCSECEPMYDLDETDENGELLDITKIHVEQYNKSTQPKLIYDNGKWLSPVVKNIVLKFCAENDILMEDIVSVKKIYFAQVRY